MRNGATLARFLTILADGTSRMDTGRFPIGLARAHTCLDIMISPHRIVPTGPRRTARPRAAGGLRSSRRLIAVSALLLAIAAVAALAFPYGGAFHLSPTGKPGARANQHGLSATTGTAHSGTGGSRSPAALPPAITKAQAEQILSTYTRVNNEANEQRSDSLLGTIEAGSSYSMDIGAYRFERVSNPSNDNYAAFGPVHAVYYIPRQPVGAYPRWFVAAVTYADLARPQQPTGSGYLLFSQASAGTAWKDVLEPNVLLSSGPAPHIATDAEGYASAVSPVGDAGLSMAPEQIGAVTAASLDGSGAATIKAPGNLSDQKDEAFWQSRLPTGSTDTDKHQAGSAPVFGLRTMDGGALLFYSLTAQLALAPPPGETFALDIPGYYSPSQTLNSAEVGYIEQFTTYDPPQGQSDPHIVADVSSIASRG